MTNVWSDEWESTGEDDWSGGRAKSTRLPRGEQLGATMYELPPDGFVLRGRPTLRTPQGERELEEGEVVHFPRGLEGAHGLQNRTRAPIRYLMASNRDGPEVVEYPDLGQVTAQSRLPSQVGEPLFMIHQLVEK
jgi:hypothetical protein